MENHTLMHLIAGMPSFNLSELAQARLEVISFFILVYLVFTLIVKFLWNHLAKEIKALPILRFRDALALMLLSGLLLYVVLTMISGARELMTPGAWEKDGRTYRLQQTKEIPIPTSAERLTSLQTLKVSLWQYRDQQERFPRSLLDEGIPAEFWRVGGHLYQWFPDAEGQGILVSEPVELPPPRWSLRADGSLIREE